MPKDHMSPVSYLIILDFKMLVIFQDTSMSAGNSLDLFCLILNQSYTHSPYWGPKRTSQSNLLPFGSWVSGFALNQINCHHKTDETVADFGQYE